MNLFDLHADTGYAVMKMRNQHKSDSMRKVQLPKRLAGGFSWVCTASYFEGQESWEDMQKMIQALHEELALCSDACLVQTKQDLLSAAAFHAICTVEGMCGIKDEPEEKIDWLYEHDIKIASLVWNEENALATGVRGNPERGLSELGVCALRRMKDHNMIVDVSHANERTFWDILEQYDGPVLATHSNARALCDHPRNLWDEQLRAIAQRDGLVGVVTAGAFVHQDEQYRDIAHLVSHMQYLKELIGIEHIALGLDFMDDYDNAMDTMLNDLNEPSNAQSIITEMRKQGFTDHEIEQIAYQNALSFLQRWL